MNMKKSRKLRKHISTILAFALASSVFLNSGVYAETSDVWTEASFAPEESSSSSSESSSQSSSSGSSSSSSTPAKPNTSALDTKLAALKKESAEIQTSINTAKGKINSEQDILNSINNKIINVGKQIGIISDQVTELQDQITLLDQQITDLTLSIEEREKQILEKELEYGENFQTLKDRVLANYKNGNGNYLEIILTSDNYSSIIANSTYLEYIVKNDQLIMAGLVETKEAIIVEKEAVELEREEIESAKVIVLGQKEELEIKQTEQQGLKNDLGGLRGESETIISSIDGQVDALMQDMELVKKESAAIEAEIQRLINANVSINTEYVGGDFLWPVPGFYKVSYGYMGYAGHTGMDIVGSGINGANIVAANDGVVISVIRGSSGYGYYTMIDHGGGRVSLYAHCSSISVEKGQKVTRGQVIAQVGTTGNSTGYHLHFEVRINGAAQNPAGYVKA